MDKKTENLKEFFIKNNRVGVAVSGGVDSAVVLCLAAKSGAFVVAYYVKTAFQPSFELEHARLVCKQLNVPLTVIQADVLNDKRITDNTPQRCYYCKKKIFSSIISRAEKEGIYTILDGTNATDDISDRPGYKALAELGVKSPLRLCRITKADIRKLAKENNIPIHSKPSYACLATRIPFGTPISSQLLTKTEKAENELMKLGFSDFRIRYKNDTAILELTQEDMKRLVDERINVLRVLDKYYNGAMLNLKARESDG